jgi:3-phenylpropionate/trans-cinnamate dioxygenase ferredoxin reductase subunit
MAGAKAAEALRTEGFDGRVVLVGREPEAPYERPPLSKDYLRGESPREKARVHAHGFYAEHEIELITGTTAVELDPDAHVVTLDDSRRLSFDRLLLATGSVPRRPPIPGVGLAGIHVFRTLEDADRLREVLRQGKPLVLVGAGWIGCEIAASARQLGAKVTLVDHARTPLEHVLGSEIGSHFAALHRAHGVDLHLGAGVERFEGDRRVERVVLTDGTVVEAADVILGVGVTPDTRLAEATGLSVDNGIVVDDRLRASAPDIFAAGDVASAMHSRYGRHIRVEHWSVALNQGTAAGLSMLDVGEPYDRLPYFFSDQYDTGLEYAGLHSSSDQLVIRGNLDDEKFQAFWLDAGGRVSAGMHVNDWDAIEPIKRLIESGRRVDAAALANPDMTVETTHEARI